MRHIFILLSFIILLFIIKPINAFIINVPSDYPSIQEGINAASDGDTVLVRRGRYYELIDFMGKGILLTSNFIFDSDTTSIIETIIDGDSSYTQGGGSVASFINNEDSNSVLCGFTIQNGIGTYSQDCYYDVYGGGGIFGLNSSPIIKNNIIRDNIIDAIHIAYSLGQGSGIYFREGSPQILNNLIMNNVVDAYWGGQGGGIFLMRCLSAQTMIYGNLIIKNEATIQGAGICAHESWVEISKNKIRSNEETQGIYCQQEYYGYPVIISNNIILDNGLSGIVGYNISAQIRNNLVAFNPRGDGISLDTYISSVVENNTVVGNGFDEYFTFGDGIRVAGWVDVINNITVCNRRYGIFSYDPSPYMTLDYNNVWENLEGQYYNVDPGPHDISCDPYFQNPFKSDFTLSDSSCCIDAGDPYSHNIPWGGFCRDIGAFEYDQGFYYDGHSIILKPFRIELPIKRR